jgi:4-hydroxy-tetrahydrodipicolinate reductase
VNGIDPGFANDVLPLALTSLSRRIDEVRVLEIADYSTYYQPVVMRDLFGFGKPLDHPASLWKPGILSLAWGSVVRQLAAGLGITLDEPLLESVDRRAADRDLTGLSGDIPAGTMGAVRFSVTGTVGGVPRVVLEHVTRAAADQVPEWPQPTGGDGCYRIIITGEPTMQCELVHRGEHGDHNVSGMIMTAQRLVNAIPAVIAAGPGLVTALDLPLITGAGLVSTAGSRTAVPQETRV